MDFADHRHTVDPFEYHGYDIPLRYLEGKLQAVKINCLVTRLHERVPIYQAIVVLKTHHVSFGPINEISVAIRIPLHVAQYLHDCTLFTGDGTFPPMRTKKSWRWVYKQARASSSVARPKTSRKDSGSKRRGTWSSFGATGRSSSQNKQRSLQLLLRQYDTYSHGSSPAW